MRVLLESNLPNGRHARDCSRILDWTGELGRPVVSGFVSEMLYPNEVNSSRLL